MTTFKTEAQFEQAFIEVLTHKGWEAEILKNKTEAELLQNWADILFENNNILYECKIKYVRNINAYDEFIMSEVQDIMSYSVSDIISKNKLII